MSVHSINSLELLSFLSSASLASRYSNNADNDAFLKESCNPPIEITNPDNTYLL